LHIWGCPAKALPYRPYERKLDSKTISCYFVGYAERSRGYKFYNPTLRSFFKTGNARFLEEVEFGKEMNISSCTKLVFCTCSALVFCTCLTLVFLFYTYKNIRNFVFEEEPVIYSDQVLVPITVQDTTLVIKDNVQTIDIVPEQDNNKVLPQIPLEKPQQPQEVPLRRSIRERRNAISNDYIIFLQEYEDDIGLTEDDPINFCQAMCSSNSKKWIDAMKDEMKSMKDSEVWDLVELPEGVKPIGCKWIFKTKKDSKGNIERYKARLIAKGFTQKESIDYKKNLFSSIFKGFF